MPGLPAGRGHRLSVLRVHQASQVEVSVGRPSRPDTIERTVANPFHPVNRQATSRGPGFPASRGRARRGDRIERPQDEKPVAPPPGQTYVAAVSKPGPHPDAVCTPRSGGVTLPPGGVRVVENRHADGAGTEKAEPYPKFALVIAGQARWEGGGRTQRLGPDALLHIPAGVRHRQVDNPDGPVMVYAIHYRPELLSAALREPLGALGMFSLDLRSANINRARAVRALFQEMLFEQDARQEGWEMVLQARLIDLAVRTLRLARRHSRPEPPLFEAGNDSLDRVAQYALRLKSHFYRAETLSDAARAVGLSRRQFTELFRKVTGTSWRQYVLGLRLRHAAGLLVETDRPVMAVAFESGFDDLSHFHHSFKAAHGCSPMSYREQRQVRLPTQARPFPEPLAADESHPGFRVRGLKGWFWTPEQYLEEIPVLAGYRLNFLMNCYGSLFVSAPGETWRNEWWRPLDPVRQAAYAQVIRACHEHGLQFCLAVHPHLASPRPLDLADPEDLDRFYGHYAWAQAEGARWFCVSLDGIGWGPAGPAATGHAHARLVNEVFHRLRAGAAESAMLCCPVAYWGDGTNPEHRAYLEVLAGELHPEVYVFWTGDGVVTPRVTRTAAESYKGIVRHRLFLWDNYPVNDGNPTLHLGPVRGRDPDLCTVVDGYLSNPLATQNRINRLPLATCADYAYNPRAYDPARSIGQAILRLAPTDAQRRVLKELVEAYPGFIVAGGSSGSNPVRQRLGRLLAEPGPTQAAAHFVQHLASLAERLGTEFPGQFPATRRTLEADVAWLRRRLAGLG